jgi:hypothetical protein
MRADGVSSCCSLEIIRRKELEGGRKEKPEKLRRKNGGE